MRKMYSLLTLTSRAPQSCIFFSTSNGVILHFVKNAIRVSATKQENAVGLHRVSAGPAWKKHCNVTAKREGKTGPDVPTINRGRGGWSASSETQGQIVRSGVAFVRITFTHLTSSWPDHLPLGLQGWVEWRCHQSVREICLSTKKTAQAPLNPSLRSATGENADNLNNPIRWFSIGCREVLCALGGGGKGLPEFSVGCAEHFWNTI